MQPIAIVNLVRLLLRYEAAERPDQEDPTDDRKSLIEAAERVAEKLRVHLSKRIGQEGFRTLLARSLSLTVPLFPFFHTVSLSTDGSLVGLRETTGKDAVEGAVALLAHFFGLLISFIGEDLTLRILRAVWPELALDGETGGENETP